MNQSRLLIMIAIVMAGPIQATPPKPQHRLLLQNPSPRWNSNQLHSLIINKNNHLPRSRVYATAKELLQENPERVNTKDTHGNTPLILAAMLGKEDLLFFLIQNKANPDIQNNSGFTALHFACKKGSFAMITHLVVTAGASLLIIENNGETPLDLFNRQRELKRNHRLHYRTHHNIRFSSPRGRRHIWN